MHAFGVFWRLTVTKIWTINGLSVYTKIRLYDRSFVIVMTTVWS